MKALEKAFAKYYARGTVTDAELVSATMRRIRIVADAPVTLPYTAGQHLRIQLSDPLSLHGILRPAETLRSYSIWAYTPRERAMELRAHLYDGDGIGLNWARTVAPGDPVTFWGPQGDFVTGSAPYHLFAGDETAVPAFAPMIEALGPGERVFGALESDSPEADLAMPGGHELSRVHRHGPVSVPSPKLLAAVEKLDLPGEAGAAYLAGEARTCQRIRDHLVRDRGWPRTAVKIKPFWTPGKRGLH
ncbi:siderophore-interacting protein [Amycolatopsis nigrescens]|uniref:siderophore-interacting protein n=1 Tax=Amycolatopsis nigrescens TaxID=381445 RepID=UPI0003622C6D|nr:siderophore-interacting protein [Amycolatopsis nigrescens]